MTTDYIVSSLPTLVFDAPAPLEWDEFMAACGDRAGAVLRGIEGGAWADLETQLRNAAATARGGERFRRPTDGCSLYWRDRILACFQERDPLRREALLDKTWWDAAGEMADVASPLGFGALLAYALRLRIALKRTKISTGAGNAAFDRLTAETKR